MTTATISFEIELDLTGTVSPGYAGDRTDPPYDPSVEDAAIEGISGLTYANGAWLRTDLLAGVNIASPDVQRLLANIMDFAREEIDTAIVAEAE